MSLQFVFGNSGAGKSYALYQQVIRESKEHPEQKFLVLVPEQFTMQTQKELVGLHPDGGILNIDVLSFNRLAYRVFEETGPRWRRCWRRRERTWCCEKSPRSTRRSFVS